MPDWPNHPGIKTTSRRRFVERRTQRRHGSQTSVTSRDYGGGACTGARPCLVWFGDVWDQLGDGVRLGDRWHTSLTGFQGVVRFAVQCSTSRYPAVCGLIGVTNSTISPKSIALAIASDDTPSGTSSFTPHSVTAIPSTSVDGVDAFLDVRVQRGQVPCNRAFRYCSVSV
jgi:hypothetical protein